MPEQPTPTPVAPAPPKVPGPGAKDEESRPDPLAASVAAAVAKLRRDAGLSERAAAKKLGTSQTQLRRMEDPRYLPSLRSLSRVASAYGAELKVSFEPQSETAKEHPATAKQPAAKTAPERTAPQPAGRTAPRASASPSKGRRAAPGRGRAAGRRSPRRIARRRRG